jgi:hypothetical protein
MLSGQCIDVSCPLRSVASSCKGPRLISSAARSAARAWVHGQISLSKSHACINACAVHRKHIRLHRGRRAVPGAVKLIKHKYSGSAKPMLDREQLDMQRVDFTKQRAQLFPHESDQDGVAQQAVDPQPEHVHTACVMLSCKKPHAALDFAEVRPTRKRFIKDQSKQRARQLRHLRRNEHAASPWLP